MFTRASPRLEVWLHQRTSRMHLIIHGQPIPTGIKPATKFPIKNKTNIMKESKVQDKGWDTEVGFFGGYY